MPALIVPRPTTIGHFLIGATIVIAVQVLVLMPLNLGFLGSPWPYAIIWAIAGWSVLGPDWRIGGLIFLLGLLSDAICGTYIGTNALIYLLSYGATLLISKTLGFSAKGELSESVVIIGFYIVSALLTGLIIGTIPNLLRMLVPALLTIALYPLIARFFVVTRDVK
ncbi:MAG: Cell shape determining protein MreD [Hyphomonadaceae bacterium]|nr:MAG: Cell shape determining protein MreD [Hyphomonadaceae bacterium]